MYIYHSRRAFHKTRRNMDGWVEASRAHFFFSIFKKWTSFLEAHCLEWIHTITMSLIAGTKEFRKGEKIFDQEKGKSTGLNLFLVAIRKDVQGKR